MEFRTMTYNKLIAEFMGYENTGTLNNPMYEYYDNDFQDGSYKIKDLCYHNSWKWLMPVVLHIEEIPLEETDTYKVHRFSVRSEGIVCEITDNKTKEVVAYSDECDKQSNIYQAVVEFIKFYNDQNK